MAASASVMLSSVDSATLAKYLKIPKDYVSQEFGEDKDILVGSAATLTLTFPNGVLSKVRNVVVLGKLVLQADQTAKKANLVACNVFLVGSVAWYNVEFKCERFWRPQNLTEFTDEIKKHFLHIGVSG